MTTTIQLEESTLQILKHVKEELHADSYNIVIAKLLEEKLATPKSMFGKFKNLKFARNDRLKFHGE
ncbi:TPA: hypothetical protein HA246_03685 [Candidatus Woesearchaeota archaeon]|nr:hypothetical protein [Candidatus Woesearchaeota archaeon]